MNVYFNPGDVVVIKQDIKKPKMVVKHITRARDKAIDKNVLYGAVCTWFSEDMKLQTERFNTKDLMHYGGDK